MIVLLVVYLSGMVGLVFVIDRRLKAGQGEREARFLSGSRP